MCEPRSQVTALQGVVVCGWAASSAQLVLHGLGSRVGANTHGSVPKRGPYINHVAPHIYGSFPKIG